MSVLMPPEPEDPVLYHDRRSPIDLDPAGPIAVEPVELPDEFFRHLVCDSGLAWLLIEPELDGTGSITGWRGVRLTAHSPANISYPQLFVPDGVESYRIPLLPAALRQIEASLRRVWRDGNRLPVTFRMTEGTRIAHYAGWCFRTRSGVGLVYRDASGERGDSRATRAESLVDEAEEAADMGSFQWLVEADVVELSPSAARLLGTPMPADIDLARLLTCVEPGDRTRVERTMRSAAQLGTAFRSRFETSPVPAAPGVDAVGRRTIRQVGRPVVSAGRVRLVGVIEDITDSHQAELSFSRAQRLASLAMLSAGIAHDFNNVLTVITMRADMMRESIAAGDPATTFDEDAEAILDAAARASGLTRQLMLFAGHQSGEPRTLRPGEVLAELRPVVENLRGAGPATEWALSPTSPILADRSQFEQIMLNLAVNARDAVEHLDPDGPRRAHVCVVLDEQTAGNPLVAARAGADRHARWVHLQVADNGRGMAPETLARACDPFFTTKARGRGTGLGLSVVFGILEQLGGWLDIDSSEGLGTTVDVFIPPAPGLDGPADQPDTAPAERAQLVVVDDDPAVRLVTARTLTHAGYAVLTADSGQQCLDLLSAHPGVAAVVSDVVMPEMDGTELARRILAEHPDIPVLLVTGFTPPTDVLGHPRLALLTKPLTALQLTSALRRLVQLSAADRP